MKGETVVAFALGAAFCLLTAWTGKGADAAADKISLRVLYLGSPGTSRERDFVGFLEQHFTKVGTGNVEEFKQEQVDDFDVVIMDYDGDPFDLRRPRLSEEYTRPTMTVGMAGALICNTLNLKTRYL